MGVPSHHLTSIMTDSKATDAERDAAAVAAAPFFHDEVVVFK